jgi:hypothetical protein
MNNNHPQENHHTCTGTCQGVSTEPGVCQTVDCTQSGMELEACSCNVAATPITSEPETEGLL